MAAASTGEPHRQPPGCVARSVLKGNRMGIVAVVALALLVGVVVANSGTSSPTPAPTAQEQRPPR